MSKTYWNTIENQEQMKNYCNADQGGKIDLIHQGQSNKPIFQQKSPPLDAGNSPSLHILESGSRSS